MKLMQFEAFRFKGRESTDYAVAAQSLLADGGKASPIRYDKIDIDGRDGAIYIPLGLADIEREIPCVLLDKAKEDAVREWLSGEGMLQVGERQKIIRILDGIEFHVLRGWKHEEFSLHVIEEPCWESIDEWAAVVSGGTISNPGTIESVPEIRISGAGTGTVLVNGTGIGVSLPSNGGMLVIDCKGKTEDHPEWCRLGWEYPFLSPGTNVVEYAGGVETVALRRRGRWR